MKKQASEIQPSADVLDEIKPTQPLGSTANTSERVRRKACNGSITLSHSLRTDALAPRMVYDMEEAQTRQLNLFIDMKISASGHPSSPLASDSAVELTRSMYLPPSELHAMVSRSNDCEPKTGSGSVSAIPIESSPNPIVIYNRLVQLFHIWVMTLIEWIDYGWISIIWQKSVQVILQSMQWIGWFVGSLSTRLLPLTLAISCITYFLSCLICQTPFPFIRNTPFCIARDSFQTNDFFILSTSNHTTEQYSYLMENGQLVRLLPHSLSTIQTELYRLRAQVQHTNLSHAVELYNELSKLIEDEEQFMDDIDKFGWHLARNGREIEEIANQTIHSFQEIERKAPRGMRRLINRSVQTLLRPVMDLIVIPGYLRPFLQAESLSIILNRQWHVHVKDLDWILNGLIQQGQRLREKLSVPKSRLNGIRKLYYIDVQNLHVSHDRLLQKWTARFLIRVFWRLFSDTQTIIVADLEQVEKQIVFMHRLDQQIQETEHFINTVYRLLSSILKYSRELRSHLPQQIDLRLSRGTLNKAHVIAALQEHIRQVDKRAKILRVTNYEFEQWERERD